MHSRNAPRIGYVLKMYPRFSETFILNEVLAHEAAGLDLEIFSLKLPIDGHFHEALARVRARVTYIGHDGLRAVPFWQDLADAARRNPGVWEGLRECARDDAHDVHAAARLSALVAERGVTHLHAHFATSAATVAMRAAAMSGISFSLTAHAKDIYLESVDHAHMRRLLQAARAVVTVSDFNLHHLRRTYGDAACQVRRVYNGLPLDTLAYTPPSNREPIIVAVGRLVEKKGFSTLVEACGVLRDRGRAVRCDIIGDGPLANDLARQIATLDLSGSVRLLGPLPQGRVLERVACAAALAAPCIVGADGNRDGLPTVLLEAMALGTPCISTNVTGIAEAVIHGQTGLIVPENSPESLADACEQLLDDRTLRLELALRARAHLDEHFDIRRNTAHLRALFAASSVPASLTEGALP